MKMIAVSMGDPNGVGPEIALRSFLEGTFPADAFIIGDISVLRFCAEKIGLDVDLEDCDGSSLSKGALNVMDMRLMGAEDVEIGKISRKAGAASLEYIRKAAALAIRKQVDAMVTLPVNKEAIMLSSPGFVGHTELVAEMCGTKDYAMMIASERMITTYVSTHVSIKDCAGLVRKDRILKVVRLTSGAAKTLRGRAKIAVAALNPHAGEAGAFGDEEAREIAPAIEKAKSEGYDVHGPVPPDTVFFRAFRGEFDAVVCMYHDQGHIAMKFSGVDEGVNATLGLPIVRTSVDHGTAFDIAYQGKASTASFVNACRMARKLISTIVRLQN